MKPISGVGKAERAHLEGPEVGMLSLSSGRPKAGPVGFTHPTIR
jgi:hypothetical protein